MKEEVHANSAAVVMDEARTIQLAKQGDAAAFEQIYRTHGRRVYALCLRMIGNPADAEEFTQDAFLQLFRKIHTFRGDSAFSTWLHRLTVNIVLMKLRKKTLPVDSLDENAEADEGAGKRHLEPGGPDLCLNGSIDRVHLQRAVDQLPPGYKQMFILHDVQGYRHEEIAGILGCSVGNCKSQLHKSRMRLRELLHETLRGSPRSIESDENSGPQAVPQPAAAQREIPAPQRTASRRENGFKLIGREFALSRGKA